MGQKRSPQPYLFLLKAGLRKKMFRGVNFASGASGLLDVTGKHLVSSLRIFFCLVIPNMVKMWTERCPHVWANQPIRECSWKCNISKGSRCNKKPNCKISVCHKCGEQWDGYFENRTTIDPTVFIGTLMTAYECHIEVSILHTHCY